MKKLVIRFLIFYLNVRVFFTMRKWQILTVLNLYQRMAFFQKSAFFLVLKQQIVTDEDYEDAKDLFQTLQMKNLSHLND